MKYTLIPLVIVSIIVCIIVVKPAKTDKRDIFINNELYTISYVINLEHHENRRQNMINQLTDLDMPYEIVKAVDKNTDFIPDFPCINNYKPGTKAIQMSNIKVFEEVLMSNNNSEYFLMFEDDSEIPQGFKQKVYELISKYPNIKVFNLDGRTKHKCVKGHRQHGMSCMLIHKSICSFLIKEMHPLTSEYMSDYTIREINSDPRCIHDGYVANLLYRYKIPSMCAPLVGSGNYKTSIQLDNRGFKDNFDEH